MVKFMVSSLRRDLSVFTNNGKFLSKVKCILISHTFHLVLLYRVGRLLSKIPVFGSFFRVFFEYFIRIVFGSDISLKSQIGDGLMIVHGHDIVIGGDVKIGRNCKILNGVTLGNKDTESLTNQQPVLGDNVVIGSGAKLLGAILIGDNVVIGANSVVLINIPSNAVVAGVPAKIIKFK
jgi:serine O-acetyltransferase